MTTSSELLLVSYGRYSTDVQDSIADQLAMNDETAIELEGQIVATVTDEGISRSIFDRPGLMGTLKYIEQHPEVGGLIVPQTDRLIGDLRQHFHVFQALDSAGVDLYSYDGKEDYADEDYIGRLEEKSVQAAQEVRRTRKRVRKSLRMKNRTGRFTTRPPFGLRMKPLTDPSTGEPLPPGATLITAAGRP